MSGSHRTAWTASSGWRGASGLRAASARHHRRSSPLRVAVRLVVLLQVVLACRRLGPSRLDRASRPSDHAEPLQSKPPSRAAQSSRPVEPSSRAVRPGSGYPSPTSRSPQGLSHARRSRRPEVVAGPLDGSGVEDKGFGTRRNYAEETTPRKQCRGNNAEEHAAIVAASPSAFPVAAPGVSPKELVRRHSGGLDNEALQH